MKACECNSFGLCNSSHRDSQLYSYAHLPSQIARFDCAPLFSIQVEVRSRGMRKP